MQIATTVLAITVRNTKNGNTVYDVACGDGVKRAVWEPELANSLNSYANTGQTVALEVETTQNGRYTNHTITGFGNAAGGVQQQPQAAPMQGQPLVQPGATLPPPGQPLGSNTAPIQQAAPKDNFPPEATTRITKLACIGTAAALVGQLLQGAGPEALDQAIEMVGATSKRFYAAARSHEGKPAPTAQQVNVSPQGMVVPPPVPTTAAEVAAQVPGVTVGAPVEAPVAAPATSGDDISWD